MADTDRRNLLALERECRKRLDQIKMEFKRELEARLIEFGLDGDVMDAHGVRGRLLVEGHYGSCGYTIKFHAYTKKGTLSKNSLEWVSFLSDYRKVEKKDGTEFSS